MSSSLLKTDDLPPDHPFKSFLLNLEHVPGDCDPFPDWLEVGNSHRVIISFIGINASARLNRFVEICNKVQPAAVKISQHISDNRAMIVLSLNRVGSMQGPRHHVAATLDDILSKTTLEEALAKNRITAIVPYKEPTVEKKPIPGARQMVSYG